MRLLSVNDPKNYVHGGGKARHSDWYENSFLMVVYENSFFSRALDRKFWLNFKKNVLIDNHYKTISYQSECSSPTAM